MKVVKANDVPTQEQTKTGAINEVLVAQLVEKFDNMKMFPFEWFCTDTYS
jgi:hypothetical protein